MEVNLIFFLQEWLPDLFDKVVQLLGKYDFLTVKQRDKRQHQSLFLGRPTISKISLQE